MFLFTSDGKLIEALLILCPKQTKPSTRELKQPVVKIAPVFYVIGHIWKLQKIAFKLTECLNC